MSLSLPIVVRYFRGGPRDGECYSFTTALEMSTVKYLRVRFIESLHISGLYVLAEKKMLDGEEHQFFDYLLSVSTEKAEQCIADLIQRDCRQLDDSRVTPL